MRGLLAALLGLALVLPLSAQEAPLSLEEARAYVAAAPEAAAQDVARLDAIERAVPAVRMPEGVLIIAAGQTGWSWTGPLEISIAGHLEYTIELPRTRARAPRPPWWPYLAAAGGGLLAGGLLVAVLR